MGAAADSRGAAVADEVAIAVSAATRAVAESSGALFCAFEQAANATIERAEKKMRRGMRASLDQVPALVATEQDARVVASARA